MKKFRFNGAILLQGWKFRNADIQRVVARASMGPSFCKDGNERRGKVRPLWTALQWGHPFARMEI